MSREVKGVYKDRVSGGRVFFRGMAQGRFNADHKMAVLNPMGKNDQLQVLRPEAWKEKVSVYDEERGRHIKKPRYELVEEIGTPSDFGA